MPIYEYSCVKTGEIFEEILPLSDHDRKYIICRIHFNRDNYLATGICHDAEKIWSVPAGDLSIGKPTRMFINNKTGEPFSPLKPYDKPPKGFHEVELRNPYERSKFEKEQQARINGENQLTSHILDSMKTEARNKRHDNIKANMNAIQREQDPVTGETVEYTLDNKDKELLSKAMEKSKKKKAKEKTSSVMLAVNHYNKSNLDEVK